MARVSKAGLRASFKGRVKSSVDLRQKMRKAPVLLAIGVAKRTAPLLTKFARSDYDSGRTVYGGTRPLSTQGEKLSLDATGDTRRQLTFKATGTQMRVALGPKYAKYLIGKYDILPNGPMPAKWASEIGRAVARAKDVLR